MAEIGGVFLSAFLQDLFRRLASSDVIEFIKGRKLSNALLNKLKMTTNSVSGLLNDAEELQITKPAVEEWLRELKHVVYDANDLMDDIAYESLRSKLEPRKHKIHEIFSSRNPCAEIMDRKLEEILVRLQHIVEQKDALGLKESIGEKPFSRKESTTSVVDESAPVYGRHEDKQDIMKLVLSDDPTARNVDVIPIVGMGGLGKTTLAKLLYNDSRVRKRFPLRAWICVSEDYKVSEIFKGILEEVTGMRCDSTTPNQIEVQLQEKLKEKKFFLVLDDIWDEKYGSWVRLSTPLISGAEGSKIIITTRIQRVASMVGTTPSHYLKELSKEDCWSLFAKHAFVDGNIAAHPDLEVIGRVIAGKCGGLPLAAKSLGGLLRSNKDAEEWEKISKSSFWDLPNTEIQPALRLSYHYLPSYLKPCFAYCALFPKDYLFTKEELVCLWMAEGFLVDREGNTWMQDVGDKYFEDLISRSFFQKSAGLTSFVMHHLMHDLAESVSREFCFRLEGDNLGSISERTRHISMREFKWKGTVKGQRLRTFLFFSDKWQFDKPFDKKTMEYLFSSLGRLRVLSLPCQDNLEEVPDSIGSLKHLRHLDLSGAPIRSLPESVNGLYNLQTLNLFQCKNLIVLPTKMGRLINLCSLDTRGTSLQKIPPEMGNLIDLRLLTDFIVGKQKCCGIKELGKLKHIQGEISIQNLQNVVDAEDANEANMKGKEKLKKLKFEWGGETDDTEHVQQVLEMLQPHTNLECLSIIGYGGRLFPTWVGDSSFTNLVSLELNECENCFQLPPLGQLSSLFHLSITAFDNLKLVGPEFYGSCPNPFYSLEVLKFDRMPHWCEWKDQDGAFPILRELSVRKCGSLKKTLPSYLPSSGKIRIEDCPELLVCINPTVVDDFFMSVADDRGGIKLRKSYTFSLEIDKCNYVENLRDIVNSCLSLKCFPPGSFPKLRELCIHQCPNLESLNSIEETAIDQPDSSPTSKEQLDLLCTSLEYVEIRDCRSLKCFPSRSFPRLRELRISECPNLESLVAIEKTTIDQPGSSSASKECADLPPIQELHIIDCPQLLLQASLPWVPTVRIMKFRDSSRDIVLKMDCSGLHCLGIRRFLSTDHPSAIFNTLKRVGVNDSLISFLGDSFPEGFHAPYMTMLVLLGCSNLELLPDCMNSVFPSLMELYVVNCPNLRSIPEGGLPSRLEVLAITNCPQLKSVPECMQSHLPSLWRLRIDNCPELDSFLSGGFPSKLKLLHLSGCDKVVGDLVRRDLQMLSSLKGFTLGGNKDVESFPREVFFPSGLASLQIFDLENLKSLDYRGLGCLSSLRRLIIDNCPKLQSIPAEGLPSSISELYIFRCPVLQQRCEREVGEDWSKIAHIPRIDIRRSFLHD